MMTDQINISKIRLDGGTQSRSGMNNDVILEYAESMRDGNEFPPVLLYYDGSSYWLADGFHRLAAHKLREQTTIKADVRQGDRRDAILYSVGANSQHGLRRTQEDKRRAIMTLLNDKEWGKWSDSEIARRCGVSKATVGKYRYQSSSVQTERIVKRGDSTYTVKSKHWGETFAASSKWNDLVLAYGLSDIDVLGMIQKGAKTLPDLNMRESDAHHALKSLAIRIHSQQFSKGMIIYHVSDRYGRVSDILPEALDIIDLKIGTQQRWQYKDVRTATEDEWIASTNQYQIGFIVRTSSGQQGKVIKADGRFVTVETTNGTRDYKRENLTLISMDAPKPDTNPTQPIHTQHIPQLIPAMQLAQIPDGLGILEHYEAVKAVFTSKREGPLLLAKITDVWAAFGDSADVFAGCGVSPNKTKFINDYGVRVFLVLDSTFFDDLYNTYHIKPIAYLTLDRNVSSMIHNWRNGRSAILDITRMVNVNLYGAIKQIEKLQSVGCDVSELLDIAYDLLEAFPHKERLE